MRRTGVAFTACLLLAGLVPMAEATTVPGTACEVFPTDNAWNMRVDSLPVHPKNRDWRRTTHAKSTDLHPDFGGDPYGIPFAVVDSAHPTVSVDFLYDDESDPGPYPFGPDIPKEKGSDEHALMIDEDTCTLYELYDVHWNGGNPDAGSGAIFDLGSNDLRPAGWTSADAAGLPIFPGLVRYDEIAGGEIAHAIRVTFDCTSAKYLWPARHKAATGGNACPPMGARFRLKAAFDIGGFSPEARVLLTAFKRYGVIVADNGSDWYFTGTMDNAWTDDLLDEWKSVPARAFQAVDARACRVAPDSAQFDCP